MPLGARRAPWYGRCDRIDRSPLEICGLGVGREEINFALVGVRGRGQTTVRRVIETTNVVCIDPRTECEWRVQFG